MYGCCGAHVGNRYPGHGMRRCFLTAWLSVVATTVELGAGVDAVADVSGVSDAPL